MKNKNQLTERLIRFPELKTICGLSRSTVWRLESEGKFPRSIRISKRALGWSLMEILQWIESKKT
jgi:prophage regulatory protein